jgi:probable rRNA maturation factor
LIRFETETEGGWPEACAALPGRCAEALGALCLPETLAGEVSVLFTDDEAVRVLNRDWRGKDKATNVLSFPADPVPGLPEEAQPLGDLALAWETVAAEASVREVPPLDHAAHLIVHGLLHLLGYDHRDGAEAREMEALEARAMAALGLHAPYEEEPAD